MFGRKKKAAEAVATQAEAEVTEEASEQGTTAPDSGRRAAGGVDGKTDRSRGPWDARELEDEDDDLVDLGSLRIKPVTGMNLNLEVEENSKAIVAVALELDGSRVQIQAFAAPKSEALWPGISAQIDESVTAQGGRTDRREGRFGDELLARVPAKGEDGSQGVMIARFVGIDGPRWFLRAVFAGQAAINEQAAGPLEDLLGCVVVDRGDVPLPPRELLPLRVPESAQKQPGATDEDADSKDPRRGPEISEVR